MLFKQSIDFSDKHVNLDTFQVLSFSKTQTRPNIRSIENRLSFRI